MVFSKMEIILPKVLTKNNATLLQKVEIQFFSNLDPKLITGNKKSWKTVKPLFSDETTVKELINIIENGNS